MSYKRALALSLAGALTVGMLSGGNAWAGEYREADVQAAIRALDSKDFSSRKSAAFKLTEMGSAAKSAVPTLILVVQNDESMSVRGEAAKALGNIGAPAETAVPALIAFLQSTDGGYERTYAATALGDIGCSPQTAVPALITALKNDSEPVVRQLAARSLGNFGAQAGDAVPSLIDAIKNGDKDLRTAAADGLAKIPASAKDVSSLTELLGDEIDSARGAAAKSLGALGEQAAPALPTLEILAKTDKNDAVREAAAAAVQRIKQPHASR